MLLSANSYTLFGASQDDDKEPSVIESLQRIAFLRFSKTARLHKKLKRISEGNASAPGLNQGRVGGSRRYSSV